MNLNAALAFLAEDLSAPVDLAELALSLARDEYPELDVEAYLAEVNGMAHEARSYVRGDLDARVAGLCRYLFHEMGFHGNQRDYYDPRNSYFNQVLERRMGIPISLSAITMAIAPIKTFAIVFVSAPRSSPNSAHPQNMPIKRHPVMFTMKVAHGMGCIQAIAFPMLLIWKSPRRVRSS